MRAVSASSLCLTLSLLCACEGGAGNDRCPELCIQVVELCGGTPAVCESQCRARFEGKTSGSIAQAAQCALEANSCAAAEACESVLVDAPQGGGGSDCPQCCDCQCAGSGCTGGTKTLTPPAAGGCYDCDQVCGTLCGQIQCGTATSAAACGTGGVGPAVDAGGDPVVSTRDAGGGGGGIDATRFISAYCERMTGCGLLPGVDEAVCRQAAELVANVLIAPDDVATCLEGKSCPELEADTSGVVEACLDVDESSAQCLDATTFRYCNRSGQCREIDCNGFCRSVLPTGTGRCDTTVTGSYILCRCEM